MSKYAYRDKDRKNKIYSSEAIGEDRSTAFFAQIIAVMQNYIFVQ